MKERICFICVMRYTLFYHREVSREICCSRSPRKVQRPACLAHYAHQVGGRSVSRSLASPDRADLLLHGLGQCRISLLLTHIHTLRMRGDALVLPKMQSTMISRLLGHCQNHDVFSKSSIDVGIVLDKHKSTAQRVKNRFLLSHGQDAGFQALSSMCGQTNIGEDTYYGLQRESFGGQAVVDN
jgi:hypothetical protein